MAARSGRTQLSPVRDRIHTTADRRARAAGRIYSSADWTPRCSRARFHHRLNRCRSGDDALPHRSGRGPRTLPIAFPTAHDRLSPPRSIASPTALDRAPHNDRSCFPPSSIAFLTVLDHVPLRPRPRSPPRSIVFPYALDCVPRNYRPRSPPFSIAFLTAIERVPQRDRSRPPPLRIAFPFAHDRVSHRCGVQFR